MVPYPKLVSLSVTFEICLCNSNVVVLLYDNVLMLVFWMVGFIVVSGSVFG